MIVREKTNPILLLFTLHGSTLPAIIPHILVFSAISAVMVWIDQNYYTLHIGDVGPFAVFGIALSLFLGFRNNAAYDRWWEGRKLWGQLIGDARSYAREVEIFVTDPELRRELIRLYGTFMHAHRLNLRKIPMDDAARAWGVEAFEAAPHPPSAVLNHVTALIHEAMTRGQIDGFGAKALTERLSAMTQAQAACERIATTPLPFVYSLLIHRTTTLYCMLVPLGLIGETGWMTPLFVGVIAYVFYGLDAVTEGLERPFGTSMNGLPLDAMCRTVEISLAPHLGLKAPLPRQPDHYWLS